ncbi:UDP-N-acetylglucosamine enolpyruvoyl transferase [Campylobacter blaseri]|uniref:UDP-N-acetylglucosamine 1-carboxyvinyltransferase n=1 Tax=Campylobacter blaseri TaxID=2042961 RepID=A0A2P8QYT7_9BACT|nr:UDP-N-acetylglucosamine 1-carboxyvinyltransferase [Campylobacter blaseri]PSM51416.1 UDP-N-acetylglucosamine 1-carboxyvinyltransferase [Campylobacter blaseri]PSM52866.1 UDP-N-acetylglucosamine 1-carboxyvinyltransferase [Campylobacter blaseri]QKF86170.1 UDP-N-acetylglucosamine enolpyruvoyl transferase [Campylobacter blaseri]
MEYLKIIGGSKLSGKVAISGAKNAALPIIALSIISKNNTEISNLPDVADIKTLIELLRNLGAKVNFKDSHSIDIDTNDINSTKAIYNIVRKMRASILVLGPLLARFGHCEVSLPGGCAIGARPIDLHIQALKKMGATIEVKDGYLVAKAPKNGLNGTTINFDKITVTGTENIVMAAALANGITKIINAAKEPEITALCEVINQSGVKIEGIGTDELTIHGSSGKLLEIDKIDVIPDRIEAGTYLCVGAITNSKITITNCDPNHLDAVIAKLEDMGFSFKIEDDKITILPAKTIKPTKIVTTEYPGFPTDMQAQFMAICCIADGVSIVEERLFENRFMHVSELSRMGADIKLNGHIATITGGKLSSADVMATDLRASSALVMAGLVSEGQTNVRRIYHLDRGYEKLEEKLKNLGANVERLSE